MSGGIKNLFADNNTFDSPTLNYALRFKTNAERGGAVENIYLRNSKVKSVGNAVVHATMLYDVGRDGDYLPQFKNITIENLTSSGGEYGIFIILALMLFGGGSFQQFLYTMQEQLIRFVGIFVNATPLV